MMEWWTIPSILLVLLGLGFGLRALGASARPARSGATGTLGSVLSIMDTTGVPTRYEAAAAVEEQKQMRLEAYSAGPGGEAAGPYGGTIRIAARVQSKPGLPSPGPPPPGPPVHSQQAPDQSEATFQEEKP